MTRVKSFPFGILKLLAVAIIIGGIFAINRQEAATKESNLNEVAPFQSSVHRYLTKTSLGSPKTPAKGKVIFVNDATKTIDTFSGRKHSVMLRPHRVPKTPSDVDSVVIYRCEYTEVFRYTNGTKGLQQVCDFKVVDVGTGVWSEWGEFRGSMPPEEVKRRGSVVGDEKGGEAVVAFMAAGGLGKE